MSETPKINRDAVNRTLGQIRKTLTSTLQGFISDPASTPGTAEFDKRVAEMSAKRQETTMNADAGKARGQFKKDMAGGKHMGKLGTAQRIARELGANGAVTIDDVTAKMREGTMPIESAAAVDPENRRFWKGAVFPKAEWQHVGTMPSRIVTNNGRPVSVWVLKSWLRQHGINGTQWDASHFKVVGIMADFRAANPALPLTEAHWYIGMRALSESIRDTIIKDKMTLYGIPVTFIPEGVGAVLQPAMACCAPVIAPTTLATEPK